MQIKVKNSSQTKGKSIFINTQVKETTSESNNLHFSIQNACKMNDFSFRPQSGGVGYYHNDYMYVSIMGMCHCEGQDLQEAVQSGTGCRNQRILIQNKVSLIEKWDQFRFLGNCPPTPPLSHYFTQNEKQVLMLAQGRSRWVVSQKPKLIRNLISDIENKRVLSLGQCRKCWN